ncbi:MAG: hypothetical protein UGE23_08440 [Peptococcaceae bacterium]|nr:hypothetical protein [Peptococcaceae bacterium]
METSGSIKISKIHTIFLYVVCWRDSGLWAEKAGEDFSLMADCENFSRRRMGENLMRTVKNRRLRRRLRLTRGPTLAILKMA